VESGEKTAPVPVQQPGHPGITVGGGAAVDPQAAALAGADYVGEEFDAQVTLLHPEHVERVLKPGIRFEVKEGLHKVAEGQVLYVFESEA